MLFEQDIKNALPILENGDLILFPSDTVWAIGCDATNKDAVEKLYLLKQQRVPENLVVLIHHEQDLLKYTRQQNIRTFDYIKGVHHPTTVVYDDPAGLAENIIDLDGTVAIRVVKDDFVSSLIIQFGKPLLSATANQEDHYYPCMFSEIENEVLNGVDYVVKYRREETIHHEPSSIIKWNTDGSISILRP
ncbi:MAG: Sua5/YciO/YrdC/YwlC family protein [Chitinophagaceae bacterium]|nr:Sua5/YciO/YrdC/YwlC family protein [Chitinophagaceae bacterium]